MVDVVNFKDESDSELLDTIEIVTVDNTANWYPENPLSDIFAFRGRGVQKLGWRNHIHFTLTPLLDRFAENDDSDMQGTVYFVKRFKDRSIACVVRVHPVVDYYGRDISMIGRNLQYLVDDKEEFQKLLDGNYIETSRVIVDDERLPVFIDRQNKVKNPDRKRAVMDCLAASAFYTASRGHKGFFCFMPVRIWEATYKRMGLEPVPLGKPKFMQDRPETVPYEVYAGYMRLPEEKLRIVTERTGMTLGKLDYGTPPNKSLSYNRG